MPISSRKPDTNILMLGPAPKPLLIALPVQSNASRSFDGGGPAAKTRLWELHPSLHCSVIGTCLTTLELRQILKKAGLSGIEASSDHDLHSIAVGLCSKQQMSSKLLHKALDRKHRIAIKRFSSLERKDELLTLWDEFLEKEDIPGAYWAILTHSHACEEIVRKAFGDVHMLSHLVGAANRADIRRLRQLEEEKGALNARFRKQENRLRGAVAERNETIHNLRSSLADALARRGDSSSICGNDPQAGEAAIIADLSRNLKRQASHISCLEARLEDLKQDLIRSRKEGAEWQQRSLELESEIDALDECLSLSQHPVKERRNDLTGKTLLYAGGRSNQVPQLKRLAQDFGADFLHHDGGVDDNSHSLTALAVRADAILFPVDCVSHSAALTVKRVCRQLGKAYFPLRSSGLSSFAGSIQRLKLPDGFSPLAPAG
jgi:Uncharacterized protein conserved in bacteria (DUF2325)